MARVSLHGEYLGDIDPDLILQNLTNTNPRVNSISEIQAAWREGLKRRNAAVMVMAEFGSDAKTKARRLVALVIDLDKGKP
jgi:hypothetical protein